ncbi:MAG: hypothetical protein ACE5OS_15060 [Anaerolineae bacterium]
MREEKRIVLVIVAIALLAAGLSCNRPPSVEEYYRYSLDDKVLAPYGAMYQVDREQCCLTEIDPDSRVVIEYGSLTSEGFSIKLHMISDNQMTFRTVTFAREHDEYVWIGEAETHYSGLVYVDPDEGHLKEHLSILCNEREFDNSGPLGLDIMYWGPDDSIWLSPTCEEALSLIETWKTENATGDND